jgi:large subunit ribosomal protein L36
VALRFDYLHTPANCRQMKYNSLLPPPAISPIATPSEEQENNNDNQNKIHVLLQNMFPCMWVRNNYATSPGIYLVQQRIRRVQTGAKKNGHPSLAWPPASRVAAAPVHPKRLQCSGRHRHGPNRRMLLDRDGAVPASVGDTHAQSSLRQPCSLWARLAAQTGDPLARFDFARPAPYLPALARGYGHEVVNSVKLLKKRDKNCRIVRRKGRVSVINKAHPRFKAARADPATVCSTS